MPLPEVTVPNVIKEMPGSGKVSFTKAGVTATRVYSLPATESDTGMTWLERLALFFGDPSTSPPTLPDPFSSDLDFIHALEATVEPVAEELIGYDEDGKAKYSRYIATISYGSLDANETISLSSDIVTQPGQNFGWVCPVTAPGVTPAFPKAPERLTEDIGKIIAKGEYVFERHQLLAPDFKTMIDLVGKVNISDFIGFDIDELLLVGIDGQRTYLPTGIRTWDLKFHFLVDPSNNGGHNAKYRSDKAQFWYLGTLAENPTTKLHDFVYQRADFTPLLQFY